MADGIALRFGETPYDAEQERLLAQVLAMPGGSTRGRAGVRPGGGFEVSIGGSPETATVAAGSAIVVDPAGGGTYLVVIPQAVQLQLPTRAEPGSTRIHEIVARILNEDHRPTDGAREVDLYIAAGDAAPSPAPPSVPAGQLRLRRLQVPSSGGIAVSLVAPRTVAVGGILPVASEAERDAINPVWDGLMVYREDTGLYEARVEGAWKRLQVGQPATKVAATSVTLNSSGAATINHGGDTAPKTVFAKVATSSFYQAFAISYTDSTFQVLVKAMATGANASGSYTIEWFAVWE